MTWEPIAYGVERGVLPYREAGGHTLHLHVWRPRAAGDAPMILDVHGGAWTHFRPRVDFYWCRELARRGYAVASAEFRRSGDAPWPACFDDVRAAAAWLRANAGEIGGDATRLGVMGGSTGGQLAALTGLQPWAGGEVDWVVALWPILDVVGRWEMVTSARFDPVTEVVARGIEARTRDANGAAGGGAADRLETLDELRRRAPIVGDALGWVLQRLNTIPAMLPLTRRLLYGRLAEAHRATFGDTGGDPAASPTVVVETEAFTQLPPFLVVHGSIDANTTRAMSERFTAAVEAAGGEAELFVAGGVGHSYGNLPSAEADDLVARIDRFATSRARALAPG